MRKNELFVSTQSPTLPLSWIQLSVTTVLVDVKNFIPPEQPQLYLAS